MSLLLLLLLLLITASCSPAAASSIDGEHKSNNRRYSCDWCRRHSTASLFPPAADPSVGVVQRPHIQDGGACGYGASAAAAMAMQLDGGAHVAAASADLFRDGAGCGACYQLRCRDRRVCGHRGVRVVVTDAAATANANANRTAGFLLTRDAFAAMARPGMSRQRLATMDHVQVDFRRVPCEYKNNLAVRVEDEAGSTSSNPAPAGRQLAIRFLYQGGQTDIAAVEVAQAGAEVPAPSTWRPMSRRRDQGGVWRTSRAPPGLLQLRLVVTAGFGGKWLRTGGAALPADWRSGQVYDTGLRVTDVAISTCTRSCHRARADDEELIR